ncbi:5-hydroxyisourate hydrolase-like protein (transthyretin family) [Comamonas odontotermitis]|uniref:5-hydroxyisourate hydrolase-like protein (Transthyretin family) n=1 Tax=Comamonas odontotermitis TaxID=379895 RepID=A0ABR6R9Z5_9BURK|nr:Ig-like domain-containing protein [Comamonas odontotermitis]MBB6575973.1 5-hydroxyisourate hydrolase-like protein (transthyretin family) [Comamonas odontotermitis]
MAGAPAHAALVNFYSATGKLGLSVDGCGTSADECNIRVNKPSATSTVKIAFLMTAGSPGATLADNSISLAGQPIAWTESVLSNVIGISNYRADVTSVVKPIIDAAAVGLSNIVVNESVATSFRVDGSVLVVVFDDPSQTKDSSVLLNFGAQSSAGDTFNVTLASPIDPTVPGAQLDMGLGISFGYQENSTNQNSMVQINGQTLTSSAGGDDDGEHANGALLTVGGIGDSNDNPADPLALATNARSDDELYSLLPFLTSSTTAISTYTVNASSDDNIFFAYFQSSTPAIIGSGILLSQLVDTHTVGATHDVQAVITDTNGVPQPNISVTFTVTSGPNAGQTFTANTDANGKANFSYQGTGGVGSDAIEASFVSSNNTITSNVLNVTWTAPVLQIALSQTVDTHAVGTSHEVQAVITDANGTPQPNISVTFTVTSGPNAGQTFTANTDANGKANFSYLGNGGVGSDAIEASFVSSNNTITSNVLNVSWTAPVIKTPAPVPGLGGFALLLTALIMGLVGALMSRRHPAR